jgi:hypothetical protein
MKIPPSPVTFTFEPGPFLSEQIYLFKDGKKTGYSQTRQYVNIYDRRFAYHQHSFPDFRRIYYTPGEYATITDFNKTNSKASGVLSYRDKQLFLLSGFDGTFKLSRENVLIGGVLAVGHKQGTLKVFEYTGLEELGVYIAGLFVAMDYFHTAE